MAQFGFPNSSSTQILPATTTNNSSASPPSSSSSAAGGAPSAPGSCCETGRPLLTDPITGQTLCSCQYDPQTHLLNYQRLATLQQLYGAHYDPAAAHYLSSSAALGAGEQAAAALYAQGANGLDIKESLAGAAAAWAYPSMYGYPYDPALAAAYPFNGQNATRETTSTLKAWLSEHKKNPYPTKGEKIMLAIITKMTLTQVSTWFANARRRLKKENKMTWEPKNRVDDDDGDRKDDDKDSIGQESADLKTVSSTCVSGEDRGLSSADRGMSRLDFSRDDAQSPNADSKSSCSSICPDSPEDRDHRDSPSTSKTSAEEVVKPRIWSIVDTATSGPTFPGHAFQPAGAGKLISSLAHRARLDSLPYSRGAPVFNHSAASPVTSLSGESLLNSYAKSLSSLSSLNSLAGGMTSFTLPPTIKPPGGLSNGFSSVLSGGITGISPSQTFGLPVPSASVSKPNAPPSTTSLGLHHPIAKLPNITLTESSKQQ